GRGGGYISAVTEENSRVRRLLVERPLRDMVCFRELDRLHTLAVILWPPLRWLRGLQSRRGGAGFEIERGSRSDLGAIVEFLSDYGRSRQFFPVYTEKDFE